MNETDPLPLFFFLLSPTFLFLIFAHKVQKKAKSDMYASGLDKFNLLEIYLIKIKFSVSNPIL